MFACDYGAAMKSRGQEDTRAKVGKATKEGIVTLRDATTNVAKGVAQTAPLAIAHAIQWIGDAGKHGVHYGESTWKFVPVLDKWITELAE